MREGQREALGLVISCLGGVGLLAGLLGWPILLETALGYVLFGGAGLGALLYLLFTLRRGNNIALGFVTLGVYGALTLGSSFGVMWYFMSYLPTPRRTWLGAD